MSSLLHAEHGGFDFNTREITMIYTIIALLVAFWLAGFLLHIGGGLIHILLVLAIVVFIFDRLTGTRSA